MRTFLTLLVGSLLFASHTLMAQDQDSTKVEEAATEVDQKVEQAIDYVNRNAEFGIKAGFNFSSLNSTDAFTADAQTGLHLGFFGRYLWSDLFSGKVELLYSSMGARSDNFYVFKDYSLNLRYLDLIASGEVMLTRGLRLEIGPYLGVLLSSQQSFHDINLEELQEGAVRAKSDETNFVDVGFMVGATYTFEGGFGVGARYQQGFTEALGNDFFQGASGSNTAFQLSALYTF